MGEWCLAQGFSHFTYGQLMQMLRQVCAACMARVCVQKNYPGMYVGVGVGMAEGVGVGHVHIFE